MGISFSNLLKHVLLLLYFFNVCLASAWQNRRNSVCIFSGRPEWAIKYVQSTACRSRHRRSVAVLSHQPLTHLWSSTVKERIGRWGPTNAPRHCDPLMWLFEIIFDGSFLLGVFRFNHLWSIFGFEDILNLSLNHGPMSLLQLYFDSYLSAVADLLNFPFWLFFQNVLSQNALVPP